MKKTLITMATLALLGGLVYTLIPSGEDVAQNLDQAEVTDAKQVAPIDLSGEALSGKAHTIGLSSDNTKIGFGCSKTVAGKTLTMRGGWSGAFGSKIHGQAIVDSENHQVLRIELQIDVGSLWSEHDQLTEALRTKGFFQVEEHPQAKFVTTKIEALFGEGPVGIENTDGGKSLDDSVKPDATHQIEGNFSLNGIEKSITFPARIEWSESELQLHSQFSLRREDYQIRFADSAGFGLLTDEDISDLVAMNVAIKATVNTTDDTTVNPTGATGASKGGQAVISPDESVLPQAELPKKYVETIPATQIQFQMVLVPGDPDSGNPPLYVGMHEVTWDEFMPWVDGRDLEDVGSLGELRAMKLRPSPPYGSVDRGFGMDRRPALSMSRFSAIQYCQWLSEQTGKKYRLPTESEWERIYFAGGGNLESPPTVDEAQRAAVFVDTSWSDSIEDWATKPVGSTEPNSLGIYDMAGNVCEWVVNDGSDPIDGDNNNNNNNNERVARGGHFDSDREDLGVGRDIEGPYWNRDYPNEPKSIWWFVNARWVGFRLVCDVPGRP